MKFKFKKSERATGRFGSFYTARSTAVIVDGYRVGAFHYDGTGKAPQEVKIKFMVEKEVTKESTCPWQWITLVHRSNSEPEAREWVKSHMEAIMAKNKIYMGVKEDE